VKKGIMPIYTNRYKAEKYWAEKLRFVEFHSTKRENKIMKEKIEEVVKNGVLVKTQPVQAGTKRSESIHGSETLQNGRNSHIGRFSLEE
jgi:hypothetical protein